MQHYKGVYRLRVPYDKRLKAFPRKLDGTYEDIDVFIDCLNKIQISHFGHGVLEVYIPSLGRGRNIIKAIKEEFHGDIIFDIIETSEEVLFQFKAQDMERLEKYLHEKAPNKYIVTGGWCVFVMTVEEAQKRNIRLYEHYIVS